MAITSPLPNHQPDHQIMATLHLADHLAEEIPHPHNHQPDHLVVETPHLQGHLAEEIHLQLDQTAAQPHQPNLLINLLINQHQVAVLVSHKADLLEEEEEEDSEKGRCGDCKIINFPGKIDMYGQVATCPPATTNAAG